VIVTLAVAVPPNVSVTDVGDTVPVVPEGFAVMLRDTVPANPLIEVSVTV
jgi:hypothetical protein